MTFLYFLSSLRKCHKIYLSFWSMAELNLMLIFSSTDEIDRYSTTCKKPFCFEDTYQKNFKIWCHGLIVLQLMLNNRLSTWENLTAVVCDLFEIHRDPNWIELSWEFRKHSLFVFFSVPLHTFFSTVSSFLP